ncbi:MAG: glycosyltransferase family 39 protein, partial [Bdellovibrionales bacterium]|nr:glycosyltransferase family 39 protein [Bdellovibrionales bacterium]
MEIAQFMVSDLKDTVKAKTESMPSPLELLREPLLLFAVLMISFRVVLASFIGLSDDEAYYWDWTREIAWSYYDHPGLTTWMVALSQKVLGQSVFAVRLPSILCAVVSSYLFFRLSFRMFGLQVAKTALFLFTFTPVFGFGSILVFPDIPLLLLWLLFMNLSWGIAEAPERVGGKDWALLAVVLGFAMLAKYPAVFLAVSLLAFVASHQHLRRYLRSPSFWSGVLIASVVASPILIWNLQYDFPSFQYHLTSRHKGSHLSFVRYGQFLASQAAVLTPLLFLGA